MKCIGKYMRPYLSAIILAVFIKFVGTFSEFLIPYVLEHLLDEVVPTNQLKNVFIWGVIMILIALLVRALNITANRMAVKIARNSIYHLRKDLFAKTMDLSGTQVDKHGLPSLTSRMTSDSYNVQNFIRGILTIGIRAPILLLGGVIVTLFMDAGLASILLIIVPILLTSIMLISRKGVPMYMKVQQAVDNIVRIMRENITGIRVIKSLSKEKRESERYAEANQDLYKKDTKASIIMALPGPITTLFLNIGLTVVVLIGSYRVNEGLTKPGVILAFLTYFNMILMGVGGLNRVFMMLSKANASANRISLVLNEKEAFETVYMEKEEDYIAFQDVSFQYEKKGETSKEYELEHINFSMKKGGSLGIIGATGSGKTTIVNLMMRFYDTTKGSIIIDGKNVKTYSPRALRKKFGVVFQNDVIFADTIQENISFGRSLSDERLEEAAHHAQAWDFISQYEEKLMHKADIHGANFSGGQKQRILITRALASKPEILILDDSSSALDYKTDALLRQMITSHYQDTTTIMVAQRISSIMNLDQILVLDDGKIIGQGTHEELLESCPLYREIYEVQMA